MKNALSGLVKDQFGFVVSTKLVIVATIAVIGLAVELSAARDGVVSELSDTAGSVQYLDQTCLLTGICGHTSETESSVVLDRHELCDSPEDRSGQADNCIHFLIPPADERS